jgi:DNA-binding winged helix-turn-helix (wHTH) protein/tetratricopeptide (TPR) repeat protein
MAASYRFGPFTLDRGAYRLSKGGTPLTLTPKVLDLLFLLVSRPSALVTKEDILQALWPDVAVTDNAITQVVSDLRQALGDRTDAPTYVQTVPRRGYRFVAPVEVVPGAALADAPGGAAASPDATRSIGVLDFTNVAGDGSLAWLASGIAETVANDLRAIGGLVVIDRVFLRRATSEALDTAADAVRPDLLVVGSYQRMGDLLRVTARVVDVATKEAVVHAKADGPLADVFRLQDAIVSQLGSGLRLRISPAAQARMSARETSSLEAYRSVTIGRLKLEALDPDQIPGAIADFEHALALDGRYAPAHIGLAHARFWMFQASRGRIDPDRAALAAAIRHAERAIDLQPDLAEAHSALGFFLASADRGVEAVTAARRAVQLEPGTWRHQFRLGMAAWGDERLHCLDVVVTQFPMLAYAYFGMAMVHVARGAFSDAEGVLQAGLVFADRPGAATDRFPGSGLHWLMGAIRLARGDAAGARAEFEQEMHHAGSRLYAAEYARDACEGLGFLSLQRGDAAGAAAVFTRGLEQFKDHPRSLAGLAAAYRRLGDAGRAEDASTRARQGVDGLRAAGRTAEAAISLAALHASMGSASDAVDVLSDWLGSAPPGSAGWMIPIEPAFHDLRTAPGMDRIHQLLAQRAR